MVYVGTETSPASGFGHLYGFDLTCGRAGAACTPAFAAETEGEMVVSGPPVVGEGSIVVASVEEGMLESFSTACRGTSCQPQWLSSVPTPLEPTTSGGVVYVGSDMGELFAFDAGCGQADGQCNPAWSFTGTGHLIFSPAVAGGMVFASSDDGHVYAFEEHAREMRGGSPAAGHGAYTWVAIAFIAVLIGALALRRVVWRPNHAGDQTGRR